MKKISILSIVAFSLVFSLQSCGPNYIYTKEYTIQNNTWCYRDSLTFDVPIEDEKAKYTFSLLLSHGNDFPNENVYVTLATKSPDGTRASKQVSLELADKTGQWRNTSCQALVPVIENATFSKAGKYSITVAQNNRRDSLEMIEKIGLKVEKLQNN